MKSKLLGLLIISAIVILLNACHSRKDEVVTDQDLVTATAKTDTIHLYYNGIIRPIREELIVSPATGIIKKFNFHYGDIVPRGLLMLTIHSPEMENDFRESINNYLRTKQAYITCKKNMEGTEALHKEKIISEQEYANETSQFQNNFLSYIEATHKLQQLVNDVPNLQQKIKNVEALSNIETAKSLLQETFDDISVSTKRDGIVLFPEQKTDGDKQLQIGYEVKKGDVLFVIGDLSGLSITANISENDINRLKTGREVILSFAAQPDLHLQGKIVSIAKQATPSDSGMATFPVVIQVPKLSSEQLQKIRVGMNAKIDITINESPAIKVPIKAVFQQSGKNWIKKIDPKTGKVQKVEVETGETTLAEVAITKGLNVGEKVIVGD